MNRAWLDLWVGLFVVAGIGALMFLALKVGSMNTVNADESYQVTAAFDNIGGLKVRAPVKSAGVVVGRVTSIGFDDKLFEAKVTLSLDKRYLFPKDSSAAILTSGLLGEQYIGLEAGGDSVKLTQGDPIKLTQSAVVLENLIGQFLYSKAEETKSEAVTEGTPNEQAQ
jgi:phospholipid/cholesterol/gamma-HCH transport system substrate-binding protein